jgi:hypothetical protein
VALSTPYQSNTASPQPVQSYGVKISQPGISASTASPTQLIFDSSWPSLATAFSNLGSFTAATFYAIPHNLGFPAFTKIWLLDANKNPVANQGVIADNFGFDSTNVYLQFLSNANAVYYYINCYNLDVSIDVDYPTLPYIGAQQPYDPSYGIKISKDGKSATSTNPKDYILHSRYRSPLIKAVKTDKTANSANPTVIQYVNSDNKATLNYGFIKLKSALISGVPAGAYLYAPYYAQSYPITTTDGITTYLKLFNGDGGSLVILRDPLFAPTIQQAFY